MEAKDNVTAEGLSSEEQELVDLPVAEDQSDETKGGSGGRLFLGTSVGVYVP